MKPENFETASKLLKLKNEIKTFQSLLNNVNNRLAVVNTEYDGPGLNYTLISNDLKIKIKELLFIIDQNIDKDLTTL